MGVGKEESQRRRQLREENPNALFIFLIEENSNVLFMSLTFYKRSNVSILVDMSSFFVSNLDGIYGNDNIETFVKCYGQKQNKKNSMDKIEIFTKNKGHK